MQHQQIYDESERIKRRRLNGEAAAAEDEDHPARLQQAGAGAAGVDASANSDLAALLLRQRLLAVEQQQQQQSDCGLGASGTMASFQQQQQQFGRADPRSNSLLGGASSSVEDPMVAHLRQNIVNQQLQAARLQGLQQSLGLPPGLQTGGAGAAEERPSSLNYLRASAAEGGGGGAMPPTLYASLLRGGGAGAGSGMGAAAAAGLGSNPFVNSLRLEALQQQNSEPSTLAEQISQRTRRGSNLGAVGGSAVTTPDPTLRATYMQSLLEAERERENEAAAVAAATAGLAGGDSHQHQSSLLARLQAERAMAAAAAAGMAGMTAAGMPESSLTTGGGGTPTTALTPAALQSLISRSPVGVVAGAGHHHHHHPDLALLGRAGAASLGYLGGGGGGLSVGGMAGGGGNVAAVTPKKRPAPATIHPNMTGRQPIHLYMSCDDDDLSPYQCLVRKQIELFEAEEVDAETNARGRNRPIVVGQVGIRCKHCKMLPPRKRERAAIYYPSKLDRLYQAGQTMASVHLGQHCNHIPEHIRTELARLREGKSAALAGKKYWSDGARALGVYEEDERLFFRSHPH